MTGTHPANDEAAQVVTVVGLGEAGHRYAEDLSRAGYRVFGYGPSAPLREAAYERCSDLSLAVASSSLVLSMVGGHSAAAVAHEVLNALPQGAVLVDLNTAHPELMEQLAQLAAEHRRLFVDAAIMAPVPRAGARSPLLLSGTGVEAVARFFEAVGATTEILDGPAGGAARLKLLRSVLMKGLAVVLLEATGAAADLGHEEWMQRQIMDVLGPDQERLVQRLLTGSRVHARRREREMDDVVALLDQRSQPAWVSRAARTWLGHLAEQDAGPP